MTFQLALAAYLLVGLFLAGRDLVTAPQIFEGEPLAVIMVVSCFVIVVWPWFFFFRRAQKP